MAPTSEPKPDPKSSLDPAKEGAEAEAQAAQESIPSPFAPTEAGLQPVPVPARPITTIAEAQPLLPDRGRGAGLNRPAWLVSDTIPPSAQLDAHLALALSAAPTSDTILPGALPESLQQAVAEAAAEETSNWDPLAGPTLNQRTWEAPGSARTSQTPAIAADAEGAGASAEQDDAAAPAVVAPTAVSSQVTKVEPVSAEEAMPWDIDAGVVAPAEPAASAQVGVGTAPEVAAEVDRSTRDRATVPASAVEVPTKVAPWAHVAIGVAVLALSAAVASFVLRPGATLGAASLEWLTAAGKDLPAAQLGPGPALWRWLAQRTGLAPLALLTAGQTAVAALTLACSAALALRLAGWLAAGATAVLLVLWPLGQGAVFAVDPGSWLALSAVGSALAALWWVDRPLLAILTATTAWTLGISAHPIGWLAVPLFALSAAVLPAQVAPELVPGMSERPDIPARPVLLPWLAALCLTFGLLGWGLGSGGISTAAKAAFAVLRAPAAEPQIGWLASLPVVGPLTLLLAQLPVALVLLVVPVVRLSLGSGRSLPGAAPAGILAAWLGCAIFADLPIPGPALSPLTPLVPLIAALAAAAATVWLRAAWANGGVRGGLRVAALAGAALASLYLEWQLQVRDGRALLGHLPGVLHTPESVLPAQLTAADRALLTSYPMPAGILPSYRGGGALMDAVKWHLPALTKVGYGAPFTGNAVLLPEPPHHPVDRAFARIGERLACSTTGRTCLYRLRD